MPACFDDDDWTLVERRRDRNRYRWENRDWRIGDDRPERQHRSDYPAPERRRTYAAVTRDGRFINRRDEYRERQGDRNRRPAFSDRRPRPRSENRETRNGGEERNQRRNGHFVYPAPTERARPQTEQTQSDDPDFSLKVRIIYKLIKSVHHLKNVSQREYPPSLKKMAHNLSTFIKPATPNVDTQKLIEQNAKNWAQTTVTILQDHYNHNIEKGVNMLSQFPIEDWRPPFHIAVSWAKRNLGHRLREETLDQTQAVIVAKMADLRPATEAPEQLPLVARQVYPTQTIGELPQSTSRGTADTRSTNRMPVSRGLISRESTDRGTTSRDHAGEIGGSSSLQGEPTTLHNPPTNRKTVTVEVHAPPATQRTPSKTASTMTDPTTGDWSPIVDKSNEEPTQPTPPTGERSQVRGDLTEAEASRQPQAKGGLPQTSRRKPPPPSTCNRLVPIGIKTLRSSLWNRLSPRTGSISKPVRDHVGYMQMRSWTRPPMLSPWRSPPGPST